MFVVNGFGASLYGQANVSDLIRKGKVEVDDKSLMQGYVSTKCICALWIPILPIASYIVLSESGSDNPLWGSKEYRLVRLDSIYRPHLKIWAYSWGTAIAAITILTLLSK